MKPNIGQAGIPEYGFESSLRARVYGLQIAPGQVLAVNGSSLTLKQVKLSLDGFNDIEQGNFVRLPA
jgi:hypothetical protein